MKLISFPAILLTIACYCTTEIPKNDHTSLSDTLVDRILDTSLEAELTNLGLDSAEAHSEVIRARMEARTVLDSLAKAQRKQSR